MKHSYQGLLSSRETESTTDTQNHMYESHRNTVEPKKPGMKAYIIHDFIYKSKQAIVLMVPEVEKLLLWGGEGIFWEGTWEPYGMLEKFHILI